MTHTIVTNSVVVAAKGQVSCKLDQEAAILSLTSGVYYSLDSVGARIWELAQTSRTVSDIRDVLLVEYEVDPPRCEGDLIAFLLKLATEGLIEIRDEMVSEIPCPDA